MVRPNCFPREHIVPHKMRGPDGQALVGCMDRRRVRPDDPVLGGDRLFAQVRGGRYGVGHGLALAMEFSKPGSFVGLGIRVADFAQGIGFVLEMAGILTTKHGPVCGGIDGATKIHNGVAASLDDPEVLDRAWQFKPDLLEADCERTAGAAQRISMARRTSSPREIKSVLTTPVSVLWSPRPGTPRPTPHVELDPTDHDAVTFIADYRPNVALDRAAANADGYGAYYSSFGAFGAILRAIPDTIADKVGGVENWWTVEAMCLGRIATHDIIDPDGTPYPIEVIGR